MSSRTKYFVVSTSTCLTVLLLIGVVLGRGASNADDTLKHIGVFSDVVAKIKTDYVEEPDMKSVTLGALNGLLEAIDPFASYLNADQYKEYLKNKDLKRADTGLLLSKKFGYVGVVGAVPNSPAAKAGFSTGDMVESIKGVATRDMPLAYASMLLQGDVGSTVEISVVRVRHPEPPDRQAYPRDGDAAGSRDQDVAGTGRLHQYRRAISGACEADRRSHSEASKGRGAETSCGCTQLRHGQSRRMV